ncbi:CDP-alcohol phosphatidyltransferase-domain-containing protein [Naematelia encephala]|uniref:CDP-alcohol phosphatidyltransferase-domain-containing protein n=1 Tax=Naematelia encephala TaxID=71784 RepID=A0A1Y2ALB0_9TREE|nr:CDP-alcohol phosphatidyltransferase-domain-containing protein [Naematelia encephala]
MLLLSTQMRWDRAMSGIPMIARRLALGPLPQPCVMRNRQFQRSLAFWSRRYLQRSPNRSPRLVHRHVRSSRRSLATLPEPREEDEESSEPTNELHESPYTIPNLLTIGRICACPFLAYTIIHGQLEWATGILAVSGFTDWLDGYLARQWGSKSVLGSILDPAADKALMTTLVGSLTWAGMLPLPLAILIFGRDVALSLWAFSIRYKSLPPPRTLSRYFDPTIPSAEVQPTQISKINTLLQLVLMGVTTVSPLLSFSIAAPLQALQWAVAGTTIWSGLSYVGRGGFKILRKK